MYIRPEDSKKFPELALFVQNLFFTVASKSKVQAAAARYAGDRYAIAILYPYRPTVRIDYDFFRCETDGDPEKQPDGSYIQKYKMKDAWECQRFCVRGFRDRLVSSRSSRRAWKAITELDSKLPHRGRPFNPSAPA